VVSYRRNSFLKVLPFFLAFSFFAMRSRAQEPAGKPPASKAAG